MDLREIKTKPTAQIGIPLQFSRLQDIAYNLWWSWSPQARGLFKMIDPFRWNRYRNPIELLIDLEAERWHELQNDRRFIRAYRSVVQQFDDYIVPDEPTWFQRNHPGYQGGPIAYFSTEFGWHECLQIYSGGLGVLSGDHSKSASDLGLPFVGVGLMYRHGYFRQTVDADGNQQHFYPDYDMHRVPLLPVVDAQGRFLELSVEFPDRRVHLRVWKAQVGRNPVLLLDTDDSKNRQADRPITSLLYTRGREMRLCQELVLGLGGVQVLRALGISPTVWHMNEGHSALLSLERIREKVELGGMLFGPSLAAVAANSVFTTHTPVPAGNETFDMDLVRKYLDPWSQRHGMELEPLLALGRTGGEDGDGPFNMTALALHTSKRCNGVSELHGKVADGMWSHLLRGPESRTVEHITNGVHLPTWLGKDMGEVLGRHLGPHFEERLLDPGFEESVQAIPDEEIWRAHGRHKRRMIELVRDRMHEQLARHGRSPDELRDLNQLFDPDVLLVCFARRFATYKRADLILRDFERLQRIVSSDERPIQFLFAGKAHPADRPGQELIRKIWQASRNPGLRERLLFLENYDMRIARYIVQGVDVWLNTPRRPLEASGTSGMKAAINGGLNCSIYDGWWCEGYAPDHGWVIGQAESRVEQIGESEQDEQDRLDAESLYHVLTEEIAPCYYDRDEAGLPRQWVQRMKRAVGSLAPRFSSARMVKEYAETFYLPLGQPSVENERQTVGK